MAQSPTGEALVITAADFRTTQITISFSTPGLQFRAAKVLGFLTAQYGDRFDGDPFTLPLGPVSFGGLPPEVPQIILQSKNGHLRLQVGSGRLDLINNTPDQNDDEVVEFITWARELGLQYLRQNTAKAGRIGCVLNRIAGATEPAKALAQHFCKQEWIAGPLNRPTEFEIHAHKRFRLGDLFEINSWVRVRTVTRKLANTDPPWPPNAISVEQDFNSLVEQMESRELTEDEILRFLQAAPSEMRSILDKYFPAS